MNHSTNDANHITSRSANQVAIIDSHCHLDFAAFDADRQQVLKSSYATGITDIVIPGVIASSWADLVALCEQHTEIATQTPNLHFALGLHPIFLAQHQDGHLQQLDDMLSQDAVVAVGEIGLDFFVKSLDKVQQLYFFEAQLQLAEKHQLPVILHARKSHDQILSLLKKYSLPGGIAHAFNGSMQQAQTYLDLGFKLGFGGMLTYERSRKLRLLAKELPLDAIVLETDSPDMTVAQHRGERNSPEYLNHVLTALAEIRSEDHLEIAQVTSANTRDIFRL